MQNPLADGAAIDFARAFYSAFAAGRPVDVAVSLGRQAMRLENHPPEDWAAPVLFLRDPHGPAVGFSPPAPPRIGPAALGAWLADRLLDHPSRAAPAAALPLAASLLLLALVAAYFAVQFLYQAIDPLQGLDTLERMVGLTSLVLAPLAFELWRGGAARLWRRGRPLSTIFSAGAAWLLSSPFSLGRWPGLEARLEASIERRAEVEVAVALAEQLVFEGDADLGGGQLEDADVLDLDVVGPVVGVDQGDHPLGAEHREDHHLAGGRAAGHLAQLFGQLGFFPLERLRLAGVEGPAQDAVVAQAQLEAAGEQGERGAGVR